MTARPLRVVIADDQALFRDGLRAVLTAHGIDVVGEAADGREAIQLATQLAPDVILMDLQMPRLSGVEATREIAQLAAPPRVVALTTFDEDDLIFDAIRAGALGYLLKDARAPQLVEAIARAACGESVLSPSVAAKLVGEFSRLPARGRPDVAARLGLSDRELAVLRRVCAGDANKQIAAELRISEGTVKNHMTSIFEKLGVTDRTQAALKARSLGLA